MVFAAILAGGIGSRMGNVSKPKQFLKINNKPIIIHTLEKFCLDDSFEKIIVLCPGEWVEYTEQLVEEFIGNRDRVIVIEGGNSRNETIMNSISYIENNYELADDDIIVTHDSVRPFITDRIIKENIMAAQEYGACDTVFGSTDTIVVSEDRKTISDIPDRTTMYQGQTPQSFKIKKLKELYMELGDEEKSILTDAAKIFVINGCPVGLVEGEETNIKITYQYDIRVAEALINEDSEVS